LLRPKQRIHKSQRKILKSKKRGRLILQMPRPFKLLPKKKKDRGLKLREKKKDIIGSEIMTALFTMLMVPESSGKAGSLVVSMITLR